jgi:hypothetical protein
MAPVMAPAPAPAPAPARIEIYPNSYLLKVFLLLYINLSYNHILYTTV